MKLFDLTSIASTIDEPFRIVNFAALGAIEVGLVICEGPKSWHRSLERRELALVLEGVITVDRPTGRVVANEGSMVSLPPAVGLTMTSGMRSTVVVFRPRTPTGQTNGYHAPQDHDDTGVEHVSFSTEALQGSLNEWRPAGDVGAYTATATRMAGVGEPFVGPEGDLLLLVYRGVVDYAAEDGEDGTVVGSQAILVPKEVALSFTAPRGATVVAIARATAVLPSVAVPTAADDDPDERSPGGGPGMGPGPGPEPSD